MGMCRPRFVCRPLRGRKILDHAEKAFYHRVHGGIVVLIARADSNAPAKMESVWPKMLFNISFVGVRIHVVVLAASLVMVVTFEHPDPHWVRLMRSGR
jgi:hypothetical protein